MLPEQDIPLLRAVRLRVEGLRAIQSLTLELDGLIVLIGENGTGKSTIIQAFLLLSMAADSSAYRAEVIESWFGGFERILRWGEDRLSLSVDAVVVSPDQDDTMRGVTYGFTLEKSGSTARVHSEVLTVDYGEEMPLKVIERSGRTVSYYDPFSRGLAAVQIQEDHLLLPRLTVNAHRTVSSVQQLLRSFQVQVPFEVRPNWQLHERTLFHSPRYKVTANTEFQLARYGFNLANCLSYLRNDPEAWGALLLELRTVLGDTFTDIRLTQENGKQVASPVIDGFPRDFDVLSDGQISYLLYCVLLRLPRRGPLMLDEPELHLHPSMVARLAWRCEFAAESGVVVVATHSATFLDQLSAPASSVRVCRLRENDRSVELLRLDPERLQEWLTDYRGVGELADTGHLGHVLQQALTTESPRGAAE
jgi:predicted ATPase